MFEQMFDTSGAVLAARTERRSASAAVDLDPHLRRSDRRRSEEELMATMTAPLPDTALTALARARDALDEAALTAEPTQRYAAAHVAALRATAALLAVRTRPSRRRGQRNAWTLLAQVAPEMGEWAAYFSAGAGKRAAAEAGLSRLVSARDADDLLRAVEHYLLLVQQMLGVSSQQAFPTWSALRGPADVA